MSLPHLILGLLKDQPLSGYDLNKMFIATAGNFWTTDQSQIYRALHKMQDDGWLDVEAIIQSENPNKKIYHLTAEGELELHRWLTTPLEFGPKREAWMGQLFFGTESTNEELEALIQARLTRIEAELDLANRVILPNVERRRPQFGGTRLFQLRHMTLQYAIRVFQMERDWALWALEQIRRLPADNATSDNDNP